MGTFMKSINKKTWIFRILLIAITVAVVASWWFIAERKQPTATTSDGVPKVETLQTEDEILASYKDYAFVINEAWVREAGFAIKKRLYPSEKPKGIIRFKPPTEYFEVSLAGDDERGATNINIVAATITKSGVTESIDTAKIDALFEKGTLDGSYDEVRELPDGRFKAEIAGSGCLVSASGFEKANLRKFVDILFTHCNEVLKKS